jgi:tRNA threonylcarbamoyladenosine biosynthesis protein TsaE
LKETVGAILSHESTPGDVILLEGALGVGKTCWARGFIRTLLGNDHARVTSPTYLLSNSYKATILVEDEDGKTEEEIISIHHMDLYRLSGIDPTELQPLALDHAFDSCKCHIVRPFLFSLFVGSLLKNLSHD